MNRSEKLSNIQKSIGGGKTLTQLSKYMDSNIKLSIEKVINKLKNNNDFQNINFHHDNKIYISSIISDLKEKIPNEEWFYNFNKSSLKPDGGILYIKDKNNSKFPILITEMKKQGTNDIVITKTGKKQAQGNAIERLGKNVIGFRTWMKTENIFPFVCFGWGCDFDEKSSILDRVVTIAEFGKLNQINIHNTEHTKRGSYYFRKDPFIIDELVNIMCQIAEASIYYYFSKYGKDKFM